MRTTRSKACSDTQFFKYWPRLPMEIRLHILKFYVDDVISSGDDYTLYYHLDYTKDQLSKIEVLAKVFGEGEMIEVCNKTLANLKSSYDNLGAAMDRIYEDEGKGQKRFWKKTGLYQYYRLEKEQASVKRSMRRLQKTIGRFATSTASGRPARGNVSRVL